MTEEQPKMILPHSLTLLVNAANLPNTDTLSFLDGVSDPYYKISFEETELVSSGFVLNNLNPTWKSVEVDITGLNEESLLTVDVMDRNFLRKDNVLGKAVVSVGQLIGAVGGEKVVVDMENLSGESADGPVLIFEVISEDIEKVDSYRALNNAFLFAFPENANDDDQNSEQIDDFIHEVEKIGRLDNDGLWSLEGILDKVKMFFASWLNNIIHCKTIGLPLYRLSVYHDRSDPFTSQFMGAVIGLRMPLGKLKTENLVTDVGNVLRGDHILFSVKDVNDNFADRFGFEAEKVELITATRINGFRFAPISLLFVYEKEEDLEPKFHLVESGTGVSNNLGLIYWGGEFDVEQKSQLGFKPTPYTSKYNTYAHTTNRNGQDPTQVTIHSYQPVSVDDPSVLKENPYISVYIDYVRLDDPDDPNDTIEKGDMISPLGATVEALERLYTLADGFGCLHPSAHAQIALAQAGRNHEWVTPPPENLTHNPSTEEDGHFGVDRPKRPITDDD